MAPKKEDKSAPVSDLTRQALRAFPALGGTLAPLYLLLALYYFQIYPSALEGPGAEMLFGLPSVMPTWTRIVLGSLSIANGLLLALIVYGFWQVKRQLVILGVIGMWGVTLLWTLASICNGQVFVSPFGTCGATIFLTVFLAPILNVFDKIATK